MMREALAAGLGNQGWSVPIWGPQGEFAIFTVNHNATDDANWAAFTAGERQGHAADLAPRAPAGEADHQQRDRAADHRPVAARARGADRSSASAQSRAAVADALHISENTLRAYIDSARHKLGALNVTHAVALALARGHHRAGRGVAEILRAAHGRPFLTTISELLTSSKNAGGRHDPLRLRRPAVAVSCSAQIPCSRTARPVQASARLGRYCGRARAGRVDEYDRAEPALHRSGRTPTAGTAARCGRCRPSAAP